MRYLIVLAALFGGVFPLDAQTALEFDAASLKPASQTGPTPGRGGGFSFYSGCSGGPGTTDPGRFTCTAVTLRTLIQRAWKLRTYQIAGPGTLDGAQYDVEARVPEATTEEQFQQMLQNLLADRFHLATHHEAREQEVYELSIAKGGHKLETPPPGDTESPREALTKHADGDGMPGRGMDPKAEAMLNQLRSRVAAMSAGRAGRAGAQVPSHIASQTSQGLTRLAGRRATIADLIGFLSNQLGIPIIDHTQLMGEWNFLVEYASDARAGNGPMAGALAQLRQSMPAGESMTPPAEPSTPTGGPTMAAAFHKQLGLKLEITKAPADMLVVDKFDKTPAAN
jgi:uncharacterized protein (TIGR03435 family)